VGSVKQTLVFDAGPLIDYLEGVDSAPMVKSAIEAAARGEAVLFAHAANLTEVFYHFARLSDVVTARDALATLATDGIERREDMDEAFCEDAGQLKAQWRRVSLADCCGVALARRLAGDFITTDRHELTALEAGGVAKITFIR
jgi:predicted nucleic acid-binding protein